MFCPNCGNDCGSFKFCPECGARLSVQEQFPVPAVQVCEKDAPESIYQTSVNGQQIDMLDVVCKYGASKNRTYAHLKREYGISKSQAKELLTQYYEQIATGNPKYSFGVSYGQELGASRQACCPRCCSTSIFANQKGFSYSRGAIGAAFGLDVGLIAGGIGSKKVICTCLKCGYQWKAGKK